MLVLYRQDIAVRLLPAQHTHSRTLPCRAWDLLPSALAPAQGSSSEGRAGGHRHLPTRGQGRPTAAALGLWPGPRRAPRQPPPHPAQGHGPKERGGGESHPYPPGAEAPAGGMAQGSRCSPSRHWAGSSPSRAPTQPRPPTPAPEFPLRKRRRPRNQPWAAARRYAPPPFPPLPRGSTLPCSDKAGGPRAACPRVPGSGAGQVQAAPGRGAGSHRANRSSGVRAGVSLTEAPVPGAG